MIFSITDPIEVRLIKHSILMNFRQPFKILTYYKGYKGTNLCQTSIVNC